MDEEEVGTIFNSIQFNSFTLIRSTLHLYGKEINRQSVIFSGFTFKGEVRSGQRSKAFVLPTTSVRL